VILQEIGKSFFRRCQAARPFCWERRCFDRPRHRRIIYFAAMTRDAIVAELLEIEGLLQDDRLNDNDRFALHGAQQALRHILDPDTWHQASQTFYRIDNKPSEAVSLLLH
jgi:hypothetical protein